LISFIVSSYWYLLQGYIVGIPNVSGSEINGSLFPPRLINHTHMVFMFYTLNTNAFKEGGFFPFEYPARISEIVFVVPIYVIYIYMYIFIYFFVCTPSFRTDSHALYYNLASVYAPTCIVLEFIFILEKSRRSFRCISMSADVCRWQWWLAVAHWRQKKWPYIGIAVQNNLCIIDDA